MMMMVMIKMVNNVAEDDDEDLLAPAGQVHLHPDTLLLPPAKIPRSVLRVKLALDAQIRATEPNKYGRETCDKYGPIS